MEPLFLVSPGKSVAANECFKKNPKNKGRSWPSCLEPSALLPARDPVSPGDRPAANHSPGAASLPSFLVFLSFPLNNKQDQFGEKFKRKSYDQNTLFFAVFSFTFSSSSLSSSGMCCKERELRVWILHLGKGKVVRHCGTSDLKQEEEVVSLFWGMEGGKHGGRGPDPSGGWCQAEIPAHTQRCNRGRSTSRRARPPHLSAG